MRASGGNISADVEDNNFQEASSFLSTPRGRGKDPKSETTKAETRAETPDTKTPTEPTGLVEALEDNKLFTFQGKIETKEGIFPTGPLFYS